MTTYIQTLISVFVLLSVVGTGWTFFVRHYANTLTASMQALTHALDTHAKHIDALKETTIISRARIESLEMRITKIESSGCEYSKTQLLKAKC